jgi:hypothetical protein
MTRKYALLIMEFGMVDCFDQSLSSNVQRQKFVFYI